MVARGEIRDEKEMMRILELPKNNNRQKGAKKICQLIRKKLSEDNFVGEIWEEWEW